MWYIEKISLKQRILTGIVGAIISGVLYAAIMFMLEDFIDWSACVFYGFFMGLFLRCP